MPAKKKKKPLSLQTDAGGRSPLWYAAMEGDVKTVKRLLKAGADPNIGDNERATPLSIAAYYGQLEAVKLLLANKADPNLADGNDTPPLHWAVVNKHAEVAALLLRAGAFPDHRNKWGVSPRKFAKNVAQPEMVTLFAAAKKKTAATQGQRALTPREADGSVDESYYWTVHARLWDKLVPPSGQAKTLQGEIIRIVGKLTREAYTNGNINWSPATAILWRFVASTLDDPETFNVEERRQITTWVKSIIRNRRRPDVSGEGSPYYLVAEKAVAWVLAHPRLVRHAPNPRVNV